MSLRGHVLLLQAAVQPVWTATKTIFTPKLSAHLWGVFLGFFLFFLKWVNLLKIDNLTPFPLPVDKFAFLFLILYHVAFDVKEEDREQAESSEEASASGAMVTFCWLTTSFTSVSLYKLHWMMFECCLNGDECKSSYAANESSTFTFHHSWEKRGEN